MGQIAIEEKKANKVSVQMGKNEAIRQIMRERQGKKMTSQNRRHQQNDDASSTAIEANEMEDHRGVTKMITSHVPIGVPHAVTFEEDVAFANELGDDYHDATGHCYTSQMHQWMNDGQAEDFAAEAAAEDSLSSSYWALMEHGLENNTDMPASWKDEAALQQLLGTSLRTMSPSPEQTKSSDSMNSASDATPEEAEPNVSWNESDSICTSLETPPRAKLKSSSGPANKTGTIGNKLFAAPREVDESDEQTNLSMQSFSPSSDDVMSEAAIKSAPSGSPFSTFRQNSTSIALQETQVYVLKIQALEEQLAQAQRQAATEAALRLELERRQGATIAMTPSIHLRTPAPGHTFSSKSNRTLSTPHTPNSAGTVLPESLWERNKTLVTEIRFADQTCVELAGQKAALEEQVALLQERYEERKTTNQSLQLQLTEAHRVSARAEAEAESFRKLLKAQQDGDSSSGLSAGLESQLHVTRQRLTERQLEVDQLSKECTLLAQQLQDAQDAIETTRLEADRASQTLSEFVAAASTDCEAVDQLKQEKKDLEMALEDARDQLNSLRDELVDNYESSNEVATVFEAQVKGLESELAAHTEALQASQMAEEQAKNQTENLTEQVKSLQGELGAMKMQLNVDRSRVAENIGRVVHVMQEQSRSLAENMTARAVEVEARLDSCSAAVKYIEDALVFDDDEEDSSHEPSEPDGDENHSIVSGETGLDATFSGRNQSADLAHMEEARANDREFRNGKTLRSTAAAVNNHVESPLPSSNKNKDTSARLSSFDEISEVLSDDVSMSSRPISERDAYGVNNDNFLHHLQWLSSPNSIHEQAFIDTNTPAPNDQTPSILREHETSARTKGNHSIFQIDCNDREASSNLSDSNGDIAYLESKLKWAESELENVRQERDLLAQQLLGMPLNCALPNERLHELHAEKVEIASKLGEASEHIAHFQATATDTRLETLQKEKLDMEANLESVGKTLKISQESLREASEETARLQTSLLLFFQVAAERDLFREKLASLQLEKDQLLVKLESNANDLKEAQNQIVILQTDASRRGSLRVRFEALQREKEIAEVKLAQKSIFPRKMNGKPESPQQQATDERDRLFTELASLREEKRSVDHELKSLTAALDVAGQKNAQQFADFESTVEGVAKQGDMLLEEVSTLRAANDNLEKESKRVRLLAVDQSGSILKYEEDVRHLQDKLQAAETDANQLQAALKKCVDSHAILLATHAELEADVKNYKIIAKAAQGVTATAELHFLESNKELNDRYLEACNHIEEIRVDRDALLQKLRLLSDELHGVEEAHFFTKSMLEDKDAALLQAEESRRQAANQAAEYRDDLETAAVELETVKDALTILESVAEARQLAEARLSQKQTEAEEQATVMAEFRERMSFLEVELLQANESLQKREGETAELRAKNESLATKCSRLRDYIRKLTKKCDEWEHFHERETNVLQQLKDSHDRTRLKASELAERCQQQDQLYTVEKKKVEHLQQARGTLENELDDIARVLANVKVHP